MEIEVKLKGDIAYTNETVDVIEKDDGDFKEIRTYTKYTMAQVGGGTTIEGKNKGETIMKVVNDPSFKFEDYSGMGGKKISYPAYVVFWHELGHVYYGGGVLNVPDQRCKSVDLENMVRQINNLGPLRSYILAGHR